MTKQIFLLLLVSATYIGSGAAFGVVPGRSVRSSRPCFSLYLQSDHDPMGAAPAPLSEQTSHCNGRQMGRREILQSAVLLAGTVAPSVVQAKDLGEDYRQGTAALAEQEDMAPVPKESYKKLASGVIYADMRPGSGAGTAQQGSRVNIQWVLRKSNGYFVDSSEVSNSVPFIFTVGDNTAIQGLDEAIRGMKEGGVRRILIPPSLAFVDGLDDGNPGPLPAGFGPRQQMRRVQNIRKDVPGEYIYLEVQLTRLR